MSQRADSVKRYLNNKIDELIANLPEAEKEDTYRAVGKYATDAATFFEQARLGKATTITVTAGIDGPEIGKASNVRQDEHGNVTADLLIDKATAEQIKKGE